MGRIFLKDHASLSGWNTKFFAAFEVSDALSVFKERNKENIRIG